MDTIGEIGFLAAGSRLRRIYEQLQASGDAVYREAGFEFKSSWFPVFYTLSQVNSPQTITEITQQIAFSHITVKNIINELKDKKLVEIRVNPSDKRSKLVSLSKKGNVRARELQPLWDSFAVALREVFETGHPQILPILNRIENALEHRPLHDRMQNKLPATFTVRNARIIEFDEIGQLMVRVYSHLEGFPGKEEQPDYYQLLANVGEFTKKPKVELLVATSEKGDIAGAVVYFGDIKYYGAGGSITSEPNASGFRLLAVDHKQRGKGIGRLLTKHCIDKAKAQGQRQMLIHTTAAMKVAWKMYENMGFKRSEDLDFKQGELAVFGFKLLL